MASDSRPFRSQLHVLAACMATTVVKILAKQHVQVHGYSIEAHGDRDPEMPHAYMRIVLTHLFTGEGLRRESVEHIVSLARQQVLLDFSAASKGPDRELESASSMVQRKRGRRSDYCAEDRERGGHIRVLAPLICYETVSQVLVRAEPSGDQHHNHGLAFPTRRFLGRLNPDSTTFLARRCSAGAT